MGIKGLTGWISSRSSNLGARKIQQQPVDDHEDREGVSYKSAPPGTVLVIDGSAFVYYIAELHSDWTKSGEYATLRSTLIAYVEAFRRSGAEVIFVWDGVPPLSKLDTVVGRQKQGVQRNALFARASEYLRSSASFLRESTIGPALQIPACIAAVKDILPPIEQHFAADEADDLCARIARRQNGILLSRDSDFFILSVGCKGYVPLDSLTLLMLAPIHSQTANTNTNDDGWQTVSPRLKGSAGRSTSAAKEDNVSTVEPTPASTIPDISQSTSFGYTLYTAANVSDSMAISLSSLPLLAVLAGNDNYRPEIWSSSGLAKTAAQKIDVLTSALRVSLSRNNRGLSSHGSAVNKDWTPERILAVLVGALDQAREYALTPGQLTDMAKKAMASLPTYAEAFLLHDLGWESLFSNMEIYYGLLDTVDDAEATTSLSILLPQSEDIPTQALIRSRILNAQESGHYRAGLMQVLAFGIYTPNVMLEDPDRTSVLITAGRELRISIWSILDNSILKQGRSDFQPESNVQEYVRRGGTIACEAVAVPQLSSILQDLLKDHTDASLCPLALPLDRPALTFSTLQRYTILLILTSSLTPSTLDINGLHMTILPAILAVRHLTKVYAESHADSWTKDLRRAALATAWLCAEGRITLSGSDDKAAHIIGKVDTTQSPNSESSLQRGAQLNAAYVATALLIEALLLTPLFPRCMPEMLYEGRVFHHLAKCGETQTYAYLIKHGSQLEAFKRVVTIAEDGLRWSAAEHAKLTADKTRQHRTKARMASAKTPGVAVNVSINSLNNRFAMLGDVASSI